MHRCSVCHFPVAADSDGPHVCSKCVMIAEGQTYSDGSDPAEGLSRGEVLYIGTRVASIRRLRETRTAMERARTAWARTNDQLSLEL